MWSKKILFIDDEERRVPVAKRRLISLAEMMYGKLEIPTVLFTHVTEVPEDLSGYDLISFDNDLGGTDVITILRKRFFEDQELLQNQLKDTNILVHSCNPVASEQLRLLFRDLGIPSLSYPFTIMSMDEKRDS
jgi:hypothetical protein